MDEEQIGETDESEDDLLEDYDEIEETTVDDETSARVSKPKPLQNSSRRKVVRKERPVRKDTAIFEAQPPNVKKRRKVSGSELNKAGPITKTKRKRLVSTNEDLELSSNDDRSTEPLVKTRKVKSKAVISQKPIKKKRAVKKTIENTEPKLVDERKIDEDKLQDDLVKDFITDD